jgi:hypothetical protein
MTPPAVASAATPRKCKSLGFDRIGISSPYPGIPWAGTQTALDAADELWSGVSDVRTTQWRPAVTRSVTKCPFPEPFSVERGVPTLTKELMK